MSRLLNLAGSYRIIVINYAGLYFSHRAIPSDPRELAWGFVAALQVHTIPSSVVGA